jgi:O6-methylguanine-DNA--protein-cysteine methyltransferase
MASPRSFALFPTALGTCAIAWNEIGLTGVWLPEAHAELLRRKVARRCDGARESDPSGWVAEAVEAITRLLAGEPVDLGGVALDSAGIDDFDRRVYAVTRTIAPGRVLTYGEVAARVGVDATARAVGQSLGRKRDADRRALPSRRRDRRRPRRLLCAGRHANQAPDAGDRGRASVRPARPVRHGRARARRRRRRDVLRSRGAVRALTAPRRHRPAS